MKKIITLFLIMILFSCKSKVPITQPSIEPETLTIEKKRFVNIKIEDVNTIKKNNSYNLGKRLLEACNTSKFKQFSSQEATEKVIKNATLEKITKTCQKINHRNGKFIDLDLLEITQDQLTEDFIFRYKIKYEKVYFKRELKITINNQNKVSSIITKEIL